jgi:hypothetical protein
MNSDPKRHHEPDDLAPLPAIDPSRLARLLVLAGPANGDALLTRLLLDLEQVRERLAGATLPADWPVLRAQTHILIAVAGAVGADRLRFLAEELNHVAHDRRRSAATGLLPQVLDGIDSLLVFVRGHGERQAG